MNKSAFALTLVLSVALIAFGPLTFVRAALPPSTGAPAGPLLRENFDADTVSLGVWHTHFQGSPNWAIRNGDFRVSTYNDGIFLDRPISIDKVGVVTEAKARSDSVGQWGFGLTKSGNHGIVAFEYTYYCGICSLAYDQQNHFLWQTPLVAHPTLGANYVLRMTLLPNGTSPGTVAVFEVFDDNGTRLASQSTSTSAWNATDFDTVAMDAYSWAFEPVSTGDFSVSYLAATPLRAAELVGVGSS